ncbi:HAD family hydrolase [Campylobacter concisus]
MFGLVKIQMMPVATYFSIYPLGSPFLSDLSLISLPLSSYFLAWMSLPRTNSPSASILPFAKDAVGLASSIADVGVVTTKTSKFSEILLENLGVLNFIKVVVGRDDVLNPKPNAEPVNLALAKLGKDKRNAFMIGDTQMDLMAAKNAGIKGIGLTCGCGYADAQSLKEHSDLIFQNAYEAVKFLASN